MPNPTGSQNEGWRVGELGKPWTGWHSGSAKADIKGWCDINDGLGKPP